MSQSTDDLTRSELRAIRGHYRRRVWLAFLVPALIAVALGWLLFQDQDANSGESSQATPRTTVSGPITREVVSRNCVAAVQEASIMLDRAAQALKDWRLHAKALDDYREASSAWPRPAAAGIRPPRWGWPVPTASTSKPRSPRRPPPPAIGWQEHSGVEAVLRCSREEPESFAAVESPAEETLLGVAAWPRFSCSCWRWSAGGRDDVGAASNLHVPGRPAMW